MVRSRDLFKMIRDTKGTFNAKIASIKDKQYGPNRNKILRRGGKNTQNYTKKISMTQITTVMLSVT